MTEARFVIQDRRAVIALSGEDRVTFLQGLVSNDVAKASPERALWAAFLTPQGKFLHEFFITDDGERLLLAPEAERSAELIKRLTLYKLRSKVEIAETGLSMVTLFGADAPAALGLEPEQGRAKAWGGGMVFVDPRHAEIGAVGFLPRETLEAALAEAGFEAGAESDYDARRIALGLPDGSRDLEPEKTVLLEAGFDELGGVDWKKGCYMGQELTARTKYRGLVKRRLLPLSFEGTAPLAGEAITQAGKEVGRLRSVAPFADGSGGRALAELRLSALDHVDDSPLKCGDVDLAVALPNWIALPKAHEA